MLALNRRGDTIIEVLIAIAIVSLVLTAAYVITNKNTVAIQGNQERIQAQHLVEAQIEALRAQGSLPTGNNCFAASGAPASGTACTGIAETGSGAAYSAAITGPTNGVYQITVKWSSLGGTAVDDSSVVMYYRLQ